MQLLLLLLLGLFLPRLILFLGWLFGAFADVWSTCLWPVLGFIFLPYTTLAYALAHAYGPGIEGVWLIILIIGVVLDLGSHERSSHHTVRRPRRSAG